MSQSLEQFISEVAPENHLRVETDLGDGFVRLKSDEAQRRQAIQDIRCTEDLIIELLRNSRDAQAKKIFLALSKIDNTRTITIVDDGCGIPEHMHDLVFEPRVTSKLDSASIDKWGVHGRGMALYSIKYNSQSAYVVQSEPQKGTSIQVIVDTSKLKERTDQSTFPQFTKGENNVVQISGPHNILRTTCEFAIEHKKDIVVYIGSPAEIVATLYSLSYSELSLSERSNIENQTRLSIYQRLGCACDAQELEMLAQTIGLDISKRTAQRILNDEIETLKPLTDLVIASLVSHSNTNAQKTVMEQSSANKNNKQKNVVIQKSDLHSFENDLRKAYSEIARKYYLADDVNIQLNVSNGKISVSIPLINE